MLLAVAAFALASALIVLLPGPDTLVVVRGIVRGGHTRGVTTGAGILCGLALWAMAAALGLAAVLRASELGFEILRVLGAAYLVWLGVQSLRRRAAQALTPPHGRTELLRSGFVAGLTTDLLNPKVGVFFVTFLPGFVPHGYPIGTTTLLFGAIFIAESALYLCLLLMLAVPITRWMNAPRIRRRLDVLAGSVLIAFGVRLAVDS